MQIRIQNMHSIYYSIGLGPIVWSHHAAVHKESSIIGMQLRVHQRIYTDSAIDPVDTDLNIRDKCDVWLARSDPTNAIKSHFINMGGILYGRSAYFMSYHESWVQCRLKLSSHQSYQYFFLEYYLLIVIFHLLSELYSRR